MNIYSILTKQKVKSKLIQSLEGFPLSNLKEMLFFLGEIDKKVTTPIIDDETWNRCLDSLQKKFKSSDCLSGSLNLLEAFSKINKKKYRSDLEEFIFESKYDDFLFDEKDAIYISTIHKAKGREFDNVYMILDYKANYTDEEKRAIYVGMTRAKSKLVIHYSGNLFKSVNFIQSLNLYGEPDEIMVQLTHRDVVLSFFEHNQNLINILQSGYTLTEEGEYLKLENSIYNVLKYSKSFIEKRKHIEELGYVFSEAKIQFIVLWQNKENNKSSYIVLPKMTFIKEKNQND